MAHCDDIKYYNYSNRLWSGLVFAALLGACASNSTLASQAPRVAVAHLADLPEGQRSQALARLPVVLEFRKGDEFPLELLLQSPLVKLEGSGSWRLVAQQPFFILLRESGPPVASVDGVDFDTRVQNSFQLGIDAHAGKPPVVRAVVTFRDPNAPKQPQ